MLNLNARNKSGKEPSKEQYFALLIQLNYDKDDGERAKAFFASLYFELTVNFGFSFVDRVFFRSDTKESIVALLSAALRVIMLQQGITNEEVNQMIKHFFIVPLTEFDDIKGKILPASK